MTGVDWPGKSAIHKGVFADTLSGRFFSSEKPFWSGPRQLSHPLIVPASNDCRGSSRSNPGNARRALRKAIITFMFGFGRDAQPPAAMRHNLLQRFEPCNKIILTRIN